jgi:hypothetical protein
MSSVDSVQWKFSRYIRYHSYYLFATLHTCDTVPIPHFLFSVSQLFRYCLEEEENTKDSYQ